VGYLFRIPAGFKNLIPNIITMKKVLFGLGNPIVGDDRIGLSLLEELKSEISPEIKIIIGSKPAFSLMEEMIGFDEAYIVDAVFGEPPGEVFETPLAELSKVAQMESMHRTNLFGAVKAGKRLGLSLPEKIQVVGIKIKPAYEFTHDFTPEISRAYPEILKTVRSKLKEYKLCRNNPLPDTASA